MLGWVLPSEVGARCSRSRSKSSNNSSRWLGSAALQQLAAAAARLSAAAHHRLPRRAIGQTGPPRPAFRRTGQTGGGGGSAQVTPVCPHGSFTTFKRLRYYFSSTSFYLYFLITNFHNDILKAGASDPRTPLPVIAAAHVAHMTTKSQQR